MTPILVERDSSYGSLCDNNPNTGEVIEKNLAFLMKDEDVYREKVKGVAEKVLNSKMEDDLNKELHKLNQIISSTDPVNERSKYLAALFCSASVNSFLGNYFESMRKWEELLSEKIVKELKIWVRLGVGRTLLKNNKLEDALLSFERGSRLKIRVISRATPCIERAIKYLIEEMKVNSWYPTKS